MLPEWQTLTPGMDRVTLFINSRVARVKNPHSVRRNPTQQITAIIGVNSTKEINNSFVSYLEILKTVTTRDQDRDRESNECNKIKNKTLKIPISRSR